MGEVGRGAVNAIGKRKGEEISGFPVPLVFFFNLSTALLSQNMGSEGSPFTENERAEGRETEQRKMC